MATVFSTAEFERLFTEPDQGLGGLADFSLTHQDLIDEFDGAADFEPVSLASDRIALTGTNPFTLRAFDLVVTGSGISPVSTLDALEQAVIDGLASGDLDRVTVSTEGFEFLRLEVTPTGYTLTSDAQVLEVVGTLAVVA